MKETVAKNLTGSSIRRGAKQKLTLFVSRPAAGFPAPDDDLVERSLDINDLVVKNPTSTFFVRVEGNSMEGAGIFSGDVLIVDRSVEPRDGKIVVAAVYGELVVKRLKKLSRFDLDNLSRSNLDNLDKKLDKGEGQFMLCSEHDDYEPITLNNDDDCYIWGVVVGSVRKFEQ